jgi:FkbM family methyltransferase
LIRWPLQQRKITIGSNAWLFKETRGARLFDKIILNSLKAAYIGLRIFTRVIYRNKGRRDKFYIKNGLYFRDFLYNSVERLGLDNSLLIVFNAPKYSYKFCSRITRRVQNFLIEDMYASMSSHEDEIVEHFNPKEGDVVVDVGAAFGFYTILSSKRVGLNGKVVAIEAQPDSCEMLNQNIKLNRLANVITLNYAAYSKKSKLRLYDSYSIIQERAENNSQKYIEVNANTLDHLMQLQGISEVNWIKIDVEGAELEVLKGAVNIISRSKDISLLIEIHNLAGSNSTLYEPITQFLSLHNFKIDFEKTYDSGEKHVIARKQQQQQ